MEQILFSCIGTTDPVRGEHDGPMLHILRHYRPAEVCLFLTPEIHAMAQKDQRLEKTQQWVRDHWDGYAPRWNVIPCPVTNAHDLDALDAPLHEAVTAIAKDHPAAEILLNVTSGTPQMQMILSQMAMDTRYRTRGIQVSNFERKSGSTERTNHRNYDIDLELEYNEDELPDSQNRCVEPKMYAFQREFIRRQISSLLERRDFTAVEQLTGFMPENLAKLARHLSARSQLLSTEAVRLAGEVTGLPFNLYSYRSGSRAEYSRVAEYYLVMRNAVIAEQYSEFIVRLEPMTLTLQIAQLRRLMDSRHISMDPVIYTVYGVIKFNPRALETVFPNLYRHYLAKKRPEWGLEEWNLSSQACDILLDFFPDCPETSRRFFKRYSDNDTHDKKLKGLRNNMAHRLEVCTSQDITDACGAAPMQLLQELEATIIACYEACDPAMFKIFDKSIKYIVENL